jgi:hypothetical protein
MPSTRWFLRGGYAEIDAARAITLRLDDVHRIRKTFVADGEATRLPTTVDPESNNSAEMQRAGWQPILDSYAAYVRQSHTST